VLALPLDVTSRTSVESAFTTVSAAFSSRLDILINNAGYLSSFNGIPGTDPDEWWRDWEVNVKGTYLVTRAFWPLLLRSDLKIILNVSSIAAIYMPPHGSAYGTTKLAMLRFTEYIDQDMLAIAVHPGTMDTELARGMPEMYRAFFTDSPELAGDTFVWLGAQRREWLGGRYVSVNWDMEELEGRREEVVSGDLLKVRLAVNLF
jgi:NAD(P)-dependent dehydrogenase (short-subunit alcohol dehydrogenase family)